MSGSETFRGVTEKAGGWMARIGCQGRKVYLGWFRDFDSAKAARIEAELRVFGRRFERREIEVYEDHAKIPLHGRGGVFRGWAVIDLEDVEKVKGRSWSITSYGYAESGRKNGSSGLMHRVILAAEAGLDQEVDHKDGDRLNNRRANLRVCTKTENRRNSDAGIRNTSGAKGVSKTPSGWRVQIKNGGKSIHLGVFGSVQEAADAYDEAALRLHGLFARTNIQMSLRSARSHD